MLGAAWRKEILQSDDILLPEREGRFLDWKPRAWFGCENHCGTLETPKQRGALKIYSHCRSSPLFVAFVLVLRNALPSFTQENKKSSSRVVTPWTNYLAVQPE